MKDMEREIKAGQKWVNYKHPDKFYEIVGVARHSETLEELVIYKALYASDDFPIGQMWARPKKMFLESVEKEGKKFLRFELVREK